jgi:EmrB/QacA subfamily drug resistance transporter
VPDSAPRQAYSVTLAVLAVSALAYAFSQTMVAPALPDIQHELGISTTQVTWVLTVYLLTASIATPILGRLGDMFGKERVLVIVLLAFAGGSLVAALSHSIGMLVAGRAIQGAGGAIFPLAFGIIRDEFPADKVSSGIGLISATFGIGGGGGLVLSGLIVDHLAYEWIFWLALIVVLGAVVATHLWVPESPVKSPAKIDWVGAGLLSAGLAALLLAISQAETWGWTDGRTLGLFALAAVVLPIWARFEFRHPEPLVDMRMMRERAVATTNITALLVGFGMFGGFILIPQFVQAPEPVGFAASVTGAGLFLLPSTMVMLFAGPLAGRLGSTLGSKVPLLMGTAVTAVSFAFLSVLHDEPWQIVFATALQGLGIGLAFAAMANLIVEAVPQTQTGVATGMNTIMRTVGGSLGGQIAASIVAAHVTDGHPAENGFVIAFALSAAGLVLAFLAAAAIPSRRARRPQARADAELEAAAAVAGTGGVDRAKSAIR